ncbi:murein hydrolase activator EnvC [Terribacillus sp. DMT04]|uniref:murein hydrolase activator EnvC family protein n=1 Tax=Terribacillus sp. DMT04 TaxID=2850441 RepID=UPI001C2C93FB|nr:M23 family metallopeptidase [Terribacillus sp. DMT04]QXE00939.1 peptidoglycan DD-metalloendopeptidase family protein [Terribacillus sp. DMT04]
MKKTIKPVLVAVLAAGAILHTPIQTSAKSSSELQSEINELTEKQQETNSKQSELQSQIDSAESKQADNQAEQDNLRAELDNLNNKIDKNENALDDKETEIDETNQKIEKISGEIVDTEKDIDKREDKLSDRLVSLQQNGGDVQYLQVLMGSKNFGDMINRLNAVTTIMDSDKELLNGYLEAKQKLETQKQEREDEKQNLQDQKDKLVSIKKDLKSQAAEQEDLKQQLEDEYAELEDQILSAEEQEELVRNQAEALRVAKEDAQSQKSDLEAEKKAAAEAKAAAQKAAESTESSSSSKASTSKSATESSSANTSAVKSAQAGIFSWPASGSKSSGFGPRWGTFHYGVDIANAIGTPVHAAASGRVSYSGEMNGYGNVIIVEHSINGRAYGTLYGHLSKREVSVGESVSRGQEIAKMGNSGVSTGSHLHFEIHVDGSWNGAKSNAVDPMKFF